MAESKALDLSRWKIQPLSIESDRIEEAGNSGNHWRFVIRENQLLVVQDKREKRIYNKLPFSEDFIARNGGLFYGKRCFKKVENGIIVGLDHGEFGGGLLFVSADESEIYYLDKHLKIRAFFEIGSKIYSVVRRVLDGKIIEIYQDDIWKYKSVAKLEKPPLVVHKNKDYYLIITRENLVKLTKHLEIEHILEAPISWNVLYPTSIYVDNNDLFIAMRKGILKIENYQLKPMFEWYVPK